MIATKTIATLQLVVQRCKITTFLQEHPDEEYNAITLSKTLELPYGSVRVILNRLDKSHKIVKTHRGFYSSKIFLDKHQVQKIDNKIVLEYHNIQFWIPKIRADRAEGLQHTPPTVPPIATLQNDTNCNIATPLQQSTEIIEVNPNQRITIIECSDHFDVIVGASQNPLGHREAKWLISYLELKFGRAQLKDSYLVKYDINHDEIMECWSPNQITYGDFEGSVIAIYQKGEITRFEGRNITLRKSYRAFLDELREKIPADEEEPAAEAVKVPKTIETLREHPPISEFRTGLQILIDRGGYKALDDMRQQYKNQRALENISDNKHDNNP